MPLKNINEELYKKEPHLEERKHKESQFEPETKIHSDEHIFQEDREWKLSRWKLTEQQKKIIKIAGIAMGIFVVLTLLFAAVVKFQRTAFDDERVTVGIDGPREVMSNQLVGYKIKFKNDNRADLNNAEIILDYSENFEPEGNSEMETIGRGRGKINLEKIKSHEEKEFLIQGKFFAPEKHIVYLKATLSYAPSNFNSQFQSLGQLGVEVKSSPLFLSIEALLEASSGNVVEYVAHYKNTSNREFKNIKLEAVYPAGFSFTEADPYPNEGENYWYLGDLKPNQEGKIIARGKLDGVRNEGKTVKFLLGSMQDGRRVTYAEKERTTKIVVSPLSVEQKVNGRSEWNAEQGEDLRYTLIYRNNGDIGLRDVIITLKISQPQGDILDFSRLNLREGAFDSQKGTITWKASDLAGLSRLAPGESGQIEFTVPVKKNINIENKDDRNFIIETIAEIDSPDVPNPIGANKIISSDMMTVKLTSKVILEVAGYYQDPNISNSGPLPPRVGEETTYTLHWRLFNVSNDIDDVQVSAYLPAAVKWKEKIFPQDAHLSYNPRTNEIIWKLGKVENAIGILSAPREVSFQVGIVPEVHQIDDSAKLLEMSKVSALDLFTKETIIKEAKEKTTALTEDASISSGYRVKPRVVE